MPILNLASKDEFELMTKDHQLCVVHFYADWVDQCNHMDKIVREMADLPEYQEVRFIRIPAEEVPEVSVQYEISAVPTFILMNKGKTTDRVEGANPSILISKLKTQVNSIRLSIGPVCSKPFQEPSLEETIKKMINFGSVTLFMKGDRSRPQCGYSRQMIEILDSHQVLYKTFDILLDFKLREGLKKFSNFPTYPQLYIYGELIGGLDIVKEMAASGELKEKLPKKCLQDRLNLLVNRHPIMLFIKGTREEPRCGFSKKIVEILDNTKIEYDVVNILCDEEVRQGLKKYSNWPTYPQLYANGELIGGLDVVTELDNAGQLLPSLVQASKLAVLAKS